MLIRAFERWALGSGGLSGLGNVQVRMVVYYINHYLSTWAGSRYAVSKQPNTIGSGT